MKKKRNVRMPMTIDLRRCASSIMIISGLLCLTLGADGCQPKRVAYYANGEAGFLIIARHELQRSATTETLRTSVDYEVTTSAPDGRFFLEQREGGFFKGRAVTFVTISKPGYLLYSGGLRARSKHGGIEIEGNNFSLSACKSFVEEYGAYAQFLSAAHQLCNDSEEQTSCSLAEEHARQRKQFLDEHYAAMMQAIAAEKARNAHPFIIRIDSWKKRRKAPVDIMKVVALPKGGLAFTQRSNSRGNNDFGVKLILLDANEQVVHETPLEIGSYAHTLTRWGSDRLALFGAKEIQLFDLHGGPRGTFPLPLEMGSKKVFIADLWRGPTAVLVGLQYRDRQEPVVRMYSLEGQLLQKRTLPMMRVLERLFLSPSGELFAFGEMKGGFNYSLLVEGMKKKDAMPHCLVRYPDWESASEGTRLFEGVDTVTASPQGIWAYARDLYRPDFEPAIDMEPGLYHQVLFRFSWRGALEEQLDVSDSKLEGVRMILGEPIDEHLLLYLESLELSTIVTFAEIDLAKALQKQPAQSL